MNHPNIVEFKVSAKYALFSDPITRVGGEKFTYQIPTYQALKGILESVYWKPTLIWYIDAVRVMKNIQTQSSGIRTLKYNDGKSDLSIYTYLKDVEYQIRAHFEWNENRPEFNKDRNENKHHNVAKRMIEKGGRRDIFLGTRECQGYVEPCSFGEGKGEYDSRDEVPFGLMFHGFTYPDEASCEDEKNKLFVRFCRPKMEKGIITFARPETYEKRFIKMMNMKSFGTDEFSGLKEFIGKEEEYGLD